MTCGYVCYTGRENLLDELPADLDVLFIGAFTQAAQLAYALSNLFRAARRRHRARRAARALLPGGRAASISTTSWASPTRQSCRKCSTSARRTGPIGRAIAAARQPSELPSLAARWKFIGGDAREGADDQDRADDRQPRVSLHLQLLHRLHRRLPAARLRAAPRRPGVPADQGEEPDRRLARPQLRRPVRRLHGSDRGGGPAGARCGTSPRAACRCSRSRT